MIITFCGHSNIPIEDKKIIEENLYARLEELILSGSNEFLLGGYGDFDILCAKVLKKLKEKYNKIESVLVIPYIDRDFNKDLYDCSEYPPIENVPKRFAIVKRNEYMVDKSDIVISYVKYDWGGAYKTLSYAKHKKKNIINII